jgi:3-methyl-2-oxobutanoate hydroxymethyltransferase
MNRLTLTHLRKLKMQGEKMTCLTVYDASFAHILDQAGIEILLVGDSLGMVIQGHETTLPVTVEHMIYHCQQVYRGSQQALLIVDMPFMSYATPDLALHSATRLLQEGHAQVVKLEGGNWLVPTVQLLTERGIPVCAHLGLTPQSIHHLGGYRVQGRTESEANNLRHDALALQTAGAALLVLECVPGDLAAEITRSLDIPVIGIGAGPACDSQVLVLYDMLGITPGKRPSFSKDFLPATSSIPAAIKTFIHEVKTGLFPGPEHTF